MDREWWNMEIGIIVVIAAVVIVAFIWNIRKELK